MVGRRAGQPGHVPRAHGEPVGAHDELALGLFAPGVVEQAPEIGIHIEQADHVRGPGNWDRSSSHDLGLPALVGFQTYAVGAPAQKVTPVFWLV